LERVRIGTLGAARITPAALIKPARHVPDVTVTAVAARDPDRARQFAAKHGIPVVHASYDALIADPGIDAIYNPLPNSLHAPWTLRAIEAGKHVLCEKPMSRHPEEVEAAFAAAERAGRHLSEAFMYRHNPQTKRLQQLVGEGAIGELRFIRSAFSYSLYDQDNIRLRTDVEGGALMDVGCYTVSGSRLVAGEPEHVFGEAWYGPSGTDWVFSGTFRFPANVIGLFHCGTALPEQDELEVIGSEGSLFLDDPWHCTVPVIELRREDGVERIEIEREDSYRLELENLSDAIRGEGELLLGRADAVGQARTLEALHESATNGQPVTI